MTDYSLVYRNRLRVLWGPSGSPLFGRRCRIVARGAMNSRLIEFEDGTLHVVSGNALRKAKGSSIDARETRTNLGPDQQAAEMGA